MVQLARGNLIVVQGPTAVGKSDLAIQLASYFSTSIVSADSRQFYREMTIGTAVPPAADLNAVKHYFVQDRSVQNPLNAGTYADEALECLNSLFNDNSIVVLAGGSGLYVNALVYGMDDLPKDESLREELNGEQLEVLLAELKERDPHYYIVVDKRNRQRIVRAVEVCRLTGKTYSSLRLGGNCNHSMNVIQVAVNRPREQLYDRINRRVDIMMDSGLLDEVRGLYGFRNLAALNTVGYKELFAYLNGNSSIEDAVALIKQNTRHYAKRQLTWLRPNKDLTWFDPSEMSQIIDFVSSKLIK